MILKEKKLSEKPEIKVIGLDLDGTTLNRKKQFADRTLKAFKEADEKGIHIVIATGRAFHSLPDNIFDIQGINYVIMANGAKIYDAKQKKIIYENCLPANSVEMVAEIIEKEKLNAEAFIDGRAYISEREYKAICDGRIKTRSREYVLKSRTPEEKLIQIILDNKDRIENISINYADDETKKKMEEKIRKVPNVTVTSSFPLNNEIGGTTTSKAEAFRFLLNLLNLKPENLMACGDSYNDLAMLNLAGVSVAMENAVEDLKEKVDYVTDTNDNDGVAKAIEKFALEKDINLK